MRIIPSLSLSAVFIDITRLFVNYISKTSSRVDSTTNGRSGSEENRVALVTMNRSSTSISSLFRQFLGPLSCYFLGSFRSMMSKRSEPSLSDVELAFVGVGQTYIVKK